MSGPRRRGLQLDDPLTPSQPPRTQETPPPQSAERPLADANRPGRARTDTRTSPDGRSAAVAPSSIRASVDEHKPPAHAATGHGEPGVWRAWSGITGVGSFRVPHELLVELGDAARQLGLPIGMIVTAAITQLLDQPAEHIADLVDRADDARIHGRRHARRRLSERTEG